MLVLLPATYLEPGVVQAHCAPVSGILDAGRYPSGDDALIARITADLDASGLSAHATPDIMRWKYAKLLSNLGNAIQAACGLDGDARPLYARVRDEAIACYRAAGIDWASEAEMSERRTSMSPMREIAGHASRRRIDVAEPRAQRRQHRDRLPQRRDRAARPPPRRADARERRAAGDHSAHGARRHRAGVDECWRRLEAENPM